MSKSNINSRSNKVLLIQPSKAIRLFLMVLFVCLFVNVVSATTYYSRVSGIFATKATWSISPTGSPTNTTNLSNADNFIIQNGHTVTLGAARTCGNITINVGGTLDVFDIQDLTLNSNLVNNGTLKGTSGRIIIAGAVNNAGAITLTSGRIDNSGGTSEITNTGTITLTTGRLTSSGAINNAGIITLTTGRIDNSGGSADITNTGTITFNIASTGGSIRIGGNFINTGTNSLGFSEVRFYGTANTTSTGFSTTGLIDNRKDNASVTFLGNISCDGIIFGGTNETINLGVGLTHNSTGVVAISNGATLNGGSSTLNLNLAGAGFTKTATGVFTPATGTINYSFSGAQTGLVTTYNNLTFSGSNTKTFATTPTVNGVLSLEGTATITVTTGVVTYGSAATLQYNKPVAYTATLEEWPATFNGAGGVKIMNTGIISLGATKAVTNNFSISTGSSVNLGMGLIHTASILNLGGEGTIPGSWGSTSSSATNKDNTFFAATTGIVNNNCTAPIITVQPLASIICENAGGSFSVTTSTTGSTFQWQYSGDGINWTVTNGVVGLSGHTSATLTMANIPSGYNGYYVRCIVRASGGCRANSSAALLTVNAVPTTPIPGTITQPDCVSATGSIVLGGLPSSGTINQTGTVTNSYPITATTMTISELAPGTYNFSTSSGICSSSATGNVVINSVVTNTWTTAWSNGTPISSQKLVFTGNYPPAIDPNVDINGCSCKVAGGASVIIKSGRTLTITNEVTIIGGGSLTFENNASLVQINNAAINSGDIKYKRTTASVLNSDYTYWSSPVANQQLINVSSSYASGMFYSYDDFAIPEDWKQEATTTVMQIGKGYIIRGSHTISPPAFYDASFVGVPNNGTKNIAIGPAGTSNLLGNPYPSAINADLFLAANSTVLEGTIYFWTHNTAIQSASIITNGTAGSGSFAYTSDDYASYNTTGGVGTGNSINGAEQIANKPTGKIAAGQGFFTTSIATGSSVTFNNVMRLSSGGAILDNSQFFKTKNPNGKTANTLQKNRVWLNLTNTQGAFKQTLVGYITDATNDYDSRFDGESFDANEFVDFYSVNQDKNLVIQGRALPFDVADEVPLGFRTTIDGAFTINIDQVDGLLTNQAVFLEDKLTNTVFDLKSGNYTFNTVAGTFNDRFVLKYSNKTLGTTNFETLKNKVLVSNVNKQIKINSFAETIDKVSIYDLLGRQIYQKDKVDSNELSVSDLISSRQALVVKTLLQNGKIFTDKIIY